MTIHVMFHYIDNPVVTHTVSLEEPRAAAQLVYVVRRSGDRELDGVTVSGPRESTHDQYERFKGYLLMLEKTSGTGKV